MTTFETTLLSLLVSSVIINVVLYLHSNRFKKIFNSLFTEIDKLQNLLSSSTSNLDALLKENKNLWNQVESLKKTKINLLTVNQGDKVICKQSLSKKKDNHTFEVLFECNVIEATEKRLKLNAFDFTSSDDWANKNKQLVIDYFQENWIERSECDIIMDQQHIRDTKLNDLLNGLEDSN
jgi:hypothetical protein